MKVIRATLLEAGLFAVVAIPWGNAQEVPRPAPPPEDVAPKPATGDPPESPPAPIPAPGSPAKIEAGATPAGDLSGLARVRAYIAGLTRDGKLDKTQDGWKTRLPTFPSVERWDRDLFWHLRTGLGEMKLRLFPDVAPNHVANFVYLTELGFFDGLGFHRVITGFMAQGGCPVGDGTGNPGYQIDRELRADVKHDHRGVLSTANSGGNTDGSQFFIMFAEQPRLDGGYTIFGDLRRGMDVLREIEKRGKPKDPAPPTEPITIEKAWVTTGPTPLEFLATQKVDVTKGQYTDSGLWVVDQKEGSGASPAPDSSVTAHYTMWIDGDKFHSSRDDGEPLSTPLKELVPGWREGLSGMRPGGVRYLVLPSELAYGFRGVPGFGIPGHATLVCEVELIAVQ